ncbi:amidohydrolase [Desulforamulus putei]|uniref:5-methylthioadenosine/S-adenosylhomocysteine deaminase n=1 Tax=Desulforamulus putei DSM 12395 TaxID=1121429 RepID=A0A1M5AMY4_9FIRM|nr:amidohydrolase [Desulforamulus putei]SHF31631.1 5-methylthioadenosine/S-adenosylhomocysteine deaminase [Desulforamulus putei DSM 12395]
MNKLLIRGATILTMEGPDAIIDTGEILIEDGWITHVGLPGSASGSFDMDEVIEADGQVAMPGFINCHTHAAMTLLRGYADDLPLMKWLSEKIWPFEGRMTGEDIYWGTMLACLEMIKSGTTCFGDMYDHMHDVARAVENTGMRAMLSRGMIGVLPTGEKALADAEELAKNWNGKADGRITVMLGPHAPYTCPPEYLDKVMNLAAKFKLGINIHVAETLAEVEEIKKQYGKTPVQHLDSLGLFKFPVLAAHCVHLDEQDMEILAQKAMGIAYNPQSNMKLASGIAPVARLLELGATVGIGTDGTASNNNLDMLEELRTGSYLQKVSTMNPEVIPAYRALQMATIDGALCMGLGDRVGLIKEGMRADIILIDTTEPHMCPRHNLVANIAYAANASDVRTVIIDGKVVMLDRVVLTIDEERVMYEVRERAERLAGK